MFDILWHIRVHRPRVRDGGDEVTHTSKPAISVKLWRAVRVSLALGLLWCQFLTLLFSTVALADYPGKHIRDDFFVSDKGLTLACMHMPGLFVEVRHNNLV